MDNKKILAVAVIVIIVIAAAAVVLLKGNDEKKTEYYTGDHPTLAIYGNADGDNVLDSADVSIIKDVISKNGTAKDYPLCDANQDGKIDDSDVEIVQNMIDGKSTKANVMCLDQAKNSTVVEVSYPLTNVVTFGTNLNANIMYFGGQGSVAAYNAAGSYPNFNAPLINSPGIVDLGGSDMNFNFSKFTELDGKLHDSGSGVGALLADASKAKNIDDSTYDAIKASGIPVLVFSVVNMEEEISTAVTLGFLFGKETQESALDYAEACQPYMEKIQGIISGLSNDDKKTVVGIIMGYMLMTVTSENYYNIQEAGGYPLFEKDSSFRTIVTADSSVKLTTTENVLVNYDDKIDCMISVRSIDAKSDDLNATMITTWEKYMTYFEDLDCYESFFYINNLLPATVKIAYMFENMYPDKVNSGFGDSVFEAIAKVCPYLDGCTVENTVTDITYADYQAAKKATEGGDDKPSTDIKTATAKAIAEAFVAQNPTTTFTAGADAIAQNFIASVASIENVGTWSVADGATADSATIVEDYISSKGAASQKSLKIERSADAVAKYNAVAAAIAGNTSYDFLNIEGDNVKITAAYRNMGEVALFRFVMLSGSMMIDANTTDYVYITTNDDGTICLQFIDALVDAFEADAQTVSWSVKDGATDSEAIVVESYTSSKGASTKEIKIIRGDSATESAYNTLVSGGIESSYSPLTVTPADSNVKVTAATKAMGSAYLVRFALLYGDVLIDGVSNYFYSYGANDADAGAGVQAFIAALTIEAA